MLDKKALVAMTSSLSVVIKAVLGKYDVVHFMQKANERCFRSQSFWKNAVLLRDMSLHPIGRFCKNI